MKEIISETDESRAQIALAKSWDATHDARRVFRESAARLSIDKVRGILRIMQDPVSLSTPVGEDEDSYLEEFIEDESSSEPSGRRARLSATSS